MIFAWLLTHKSAPLAVRERCSLTGAALHNAYEHLLRQPPVHSCLILSTCNRTEIYLSLSPGELAGDQPGEGTSSWPGEVTSKWLDDVVVEALGLRTGDVPKLSEMRSIRRDEEAVAHLMAVAGGLESSLVGDAQILGQVRAAWREAKLVAASRDTEPFAASRDTELFAASRRQDDRHGEVDDELRFMMAAVLQAGRRVRAETGLGQGAVSVGSVAARKYRLLFTAAEPLRVLLVGSGKTALLTARHLRREGVRQFRVAARNGAAAAAVAAEVGGVAIGLDALPSELATADIVVGTSASPQPLISAEMVRRGQQDRRYKPQLLLDLAVPRDIDAEVAQIPEAFLLNLDQLEEEADDNLASREGAVADAERIVREEMGLFRRRAGLRGAASLVLGFRDLGESEVERVVQSLSALLAAGELSEDELRAQLRGLSRHLMHLPTVLLRESGSGSLEEVRERWSALLRQQRQGGAAGNGAAEAGAAETGSAAGGDKEQ